MQAGQGIVRLGVVEVPALADAHRLPIIVGMALQAVLPQPPLMVVFMASGARGGKTQIRLAQILNLDRRPLALRDMLRRMTLGAGKTRVFSFECISGLLVIEALDVKFDQRKILAVVVGVATGTLLAGSRLDVVRRVQSLVGLDAGSNFRVAFTAPKSWGPTRQLMTGRTVGGTVQRLMGTRQRSRRNLRCQVWQSQQAQQHNSPGNHSRPL